MAGLITLCISDLVLGFGNGTITIFIGIGLWGLHMGLTQGTLAALVADSCSPEQRGTAYGLFNLFSAIALLLANAIAGVLWDQLGSKVTFLVGGMFSPLSFIVFLFTISLWNPSFYRNSTD